ncbi:MAG: EAL domain-containing protein [Planctomycetaceae bacterium]|nr:EAL domain-containing protein [Planctomycetaceae bacterium]
MTDSAITIMIEAMTPSVEQSCQDPGKSPAGPLSGNLPSNRETTHLDILTGLPNRLCFMEELQRAVNTHRPSGPMLSLLFFDLDGFKFVNDSLGHQAGDEVLIQVGQRLGQVLVEPRERLFRLAGDEFVVIADHVERLNQLPKLAERILAAFQEPFIVMHEKAFVGASIGIAIRHQQGQTAEQLLNQADAAMYQSKRNGRRCYSFYSVDLDQEHRRLFQLRGDIREAIENQEFTVHYQPKFDLATGECCGAEALVRWFRNGEIYSRPEEFVAEAEKCGLIVPLSQVVIRAVARDIKCWEALGHRMVPISINISASHFRFGDLQEDLASAFFFQGINPGLVEVELTEEAVLHDLKLSGKKIRDLKQMGFSVTIDDLGTGRSSIAYLQKLTVDIVKIDESFVQEILDSEFALAVVDSMIRIAHTAKLRVVAEGVESPEICDCLRTLSCDHVQGYLFGAACDAESLFAQLQFPAALASCQSTSM